jgi:hypothetical protein
LVLLHIAQPKEVDYYTDHATLASNDGDVRRQSIKTANTAISSTWLFTLGPQQVNWFGLVVISSNVKEFT